MFLFVCLSFAFKAGCLLVLGRLILVSLLTGDFFVLVYLAGCGLFNVVIVMIWL